MIHSLNSTSPPVDTIKNPTNANQTMISDETISEIYSNALCLNPNSFLSDTPLDFFSKIISIEDPTSPPTGPVNSDPSDSSETIPVEWENTFPHFEFACNLNLMDPSASLINHPLNFEILKRAPLIRELVGKKRPRYCDTTPLPLEKMRRLRYSDGPLESWEVLQYAARMQRLLNADDNNENQSF